MIFCERMKKSKTSKRTRFSTMRYYLNANSTNFTPRRLFIPTIMRRQTCSYLILAALTLHVSFAYVVLPRRSTALEAYKSEPEPLARQVRVVSPLATLASLFFAPHDAQASAKVSAFESAVQQYFPGARSSSIVALRVIAALRKRDYRPSNTLLGSSVCSDEINETPKALVQQLENKLGKTGAVFHLGGLGGLPFVGTSGMGAFVSHSPQNGKLLIMFGPHVGISESGELGKVMRAGMQNESASCGAAMAAYKAIAAGLTTTKNKSNFDFQEDYIKDKLKKKLGTLAGKEAQGGDDTIALVTRNMYDLVWDLIKIEVDSVTSKADFWKNISEVTLLGGIIINRSALGGKTTFNLSP